MIEQEQKQYCIHSDRCRYRGCPHHKNYIGHTNATYIGIAELEEMNNCTVWLDR